MGTKVLEKGIQFVFFSLSQIGFHYLLPFSFGKYNFTSDICAFAMLCFFACNIAFVVYKPPLTNLSPFKHSLFFPSNGLFLHFQLNIPAVIVHMFIYVLTSNFCQSASVVYRQACSPRVGYIEGSSRGRLQPRTMKFVFSASSRSTQL